METVTRTGPLSSYRVLDLAGPLGLHCTKLLADMGADVIKIEVPSGDESRRIPPFKDDTPHPEKSLYFLHFNTNKRSITLDLEKPDGRAVFLELVRKADVVLETARPGRMDELGIGYSTLRAQNSGLVYAAITPFGQTGPWRDYKANDMAGIALGNLLYLAGEPGEGRCSHPVKSPMAWRRAMERSASRSLCITGSIAARANISMFRCMSAPVTSPAISSPITATPEKNPRVRRARAKRLICTTRIAQRTAMPVFSLFLSSNGAGWSIGWAARPKFPVRSSRKWLTGANTQILSPKPSPSFARGIPKRNCTTRVRNGASR